SPLTMLDFRAQRLEAQVADLRESGLVERSEEVKALYDDMLRELALITEERALLLQQTWNDMLAGIFESMTDTISNLIATGLFEGVFDDPDRERRELDRSFERD